MQTLQAKIDLLGCLKGKSGWKSDCRKERDRCRDVASREATVGVAEAQTGLHPGAA